MPGSPNNNALLTGNWGPIPETGEGGKPIWEQPWLYSNEAIDAWRASLVKYRGYTPERAAEEFPYNREYIPENDVPDRAWLEGHPEIRPQRPSFNFNQLLQSVRDKP